ncbi:MAG: nucleoid occlusion factor SlmA [gamma proteobacterium symbiont of Taylorina sp.]|nr:nucleoid occlusion factor SlmA [gamma proteobacterium symbiont of Taylorina sp.]
MKAQSSKINRKEQILQTLAFELEKKPGERITTANLAKAVGVSEAALYRHFPSKAKMFEALIEFSENSVFGLINQITNEKIDSLQKIESITRLLLGFSSKNPGITRILSGDALVGENERLMKRADQFFQRLETQLKQVLREGELKGQLQYSGNISQFAEILSSFIEGQLSQYVRTRFAKKPDENWESKWPFFVNSINKVKE